MLLEMAGRLAACGEIPTINEVVKTSYKQSVKILWIAILPKSGKSIGRGRSLTRHGTLLKSSVPIRITNWDTTIIGFMEMDTVAHCGDILSGEFIYSLDMVEIATGWSEQIAVMGKGEAGIVKGHRSN